MPPFNVFRLIACSSGLSQSGIAAALQVNEDKIEEIECNINMNMSDDDTTREEIVLKSTLSKRGGRVLVLRNAHHRIVTQILSLSHVSQAETASSVKILVLDGYSAPWVVEPIFGDEFRKIRVLSLPMVPTVPDSNADNGLDDETRRAHIRMVCDEYPMCFEAQPSNRG